MNQKQVWETIANSWSNLRVKPWREVEEFSEKVFHGIVLDVGCGNCRNLVPFLNKKIKCIGLDFSKNMIKESKIFLKRRDLETSLIVANSEKMPLKNDCVNAIICTNVIHNINSKEKRIAALKDMDRVLKQNGKILLSVWNRCQKRFLLNFILSFFSSHYSDVFVDWNYHGKKYKRFYHLYTKNELETDLRLAGFNKIKIWNDKRGNIWSLVEK